MARVVWRLRSEGGTRATCSITEAEDEVVLRLRFSAVRDDVVCEHYGEMAGALARASSLRDMLCDCRWTPIEANSQ